MLQVRFDYLHGMNFQDAVNLSQSSGFRRQVENYLKDYRRHRNFENLVENHLDYSRFYDWIDQVAEYQNVPGSIVLSSGCGSAGDLMAFLEKGALEVHGVEVEPQLVELARSRFKGTSYESAVEIHQYQGRKLPFLDNAFNIIFSIHVIEHVEDRLLYLSEIFRVLKPGGILFLDVPNRYYRLEQHTDLPLIHCLPGRALRLIQFLLNFLLPLKRFSYDLWFRLVTVPDIPSAQSLINLYYQCKDQYGLLLESSEFHSYTGEYLDFHRNPPSYFHGQARRHTTFRMVIRKHVP